MQFSLCFAFKLLDACPQYPPPGYATVCVAIFFAHGVFCGSHSRVCFIIFLFFTAFPPECIYFDGRHSVECLQRIWIIHGCVEHGSEYPVDATSMKAIYSDGTTLW